MKTRQQIIDETTKKLASDPNTDPPRVSMVGFMPEELAAALTPARNDRARQLLEGVKAANPRREIIVIREQLLEALAGEGDESGRQPTGQPGPGGSGGAA